MRWRRVAGAFPWWTAALLGGFVALELFWWWSWFAWELRPLERYYLPAYFLSTEGAKHSGSMTRIDPLFKTAPGRKSEIVLAPDVTSGRDGNLPLQLSQSAREHGWVGIGKGQPIWDDSTAVEDFLRDDIYQGRGLWQLVAEPLAEGLSFLLLLVVIGLVFVRETLTTEWRHLWTALTKPDWTSDYHWDSLATRRGMESRIGVHWEVRRWVEEIWFRRVKPALQASRPIVTKRDSEPIRDSIATDEPSRSVPIPPASGRRQSDSAPQLRLESPPISQAKRPAKPRFIFPGTEGVRTSNRKPTPWDESQWID